jgi:hypothetical protein
MKSLPNQRRAEVNYGVYCDQVTGRTKTHKLHGYAIFYCVLYHLADRGDELQPIHDRHLSSVACSVGGGESRKNGRKVKKA